ncbi:hypothetical protein CY34DRAFT_810124 [Suillus luteus UH-Slu-Lm8-n1]|uniref:Uncharacterized protein n=1 Tax=Suillus luteus UH-Slu-Lm8-n1 TaxID=930992 RepID=A0A0D0ATQ4_9AGAM|nr:hypothetical protein CY34DRAFT_810124 [Suillus luteus UH-Slu-Lm8-n1]
MCGMLCVHKYTASAWHLNWIQVVPRLYRDIRDSYFTDQKSDQKYVPSNDSDSDLSKKTATAK